MTCGELERLFLTGASEQETAAHCAGCSACAALAADLEGLGALLSDLRSPAASPALREALFAIPSKTVSCVGSDRLIAAELEGALSLNDRVRLEFHRSRCEACAEAGLALVGMRDLARPEPAPWLAGRLAASRPPRRERSGWRLLLNPKAAIGLAYGAAVVLMLAGFNPADLARKAGVGKIEESARATVQVAGNSVSDRVGALEESALRRIAAWGGRAVGYGRAALSTAIQLVMKSEPQRPPRRPRNGEDKGLLQKNEAETWIWRA